MITLEPITRENLRAVVALRPQDEQEYLIDPVVFSIAKTYVEPTWTPFVIVAEGTMVGFVLVGREVDTGIDWIDSFVIDQRYQRRGYGRAAMQAIIERLRSAPDYRGIRLSYYRGNDAAEALYRSVGFEHTGEIDDDDEVYMRFVARTP